MFPNPSLPLPTPPPPLAPLITLTDALHNNLTIPGALEGGKGASHLSTYHYLLPVVYRPREG